MGQTKRKTSRDLLDDFPVNSQTSSGVLQDIAVAIDPPPDGAIGIRELLDRLDFMAKADFFSPKNKLLDDTPSPLGASSGWNIYDFADPETFTGPLDITDWNCDDLQIILRQMIRMRTTSNSLTNLIKEGQAVASPQPAISSEALATGLSQNTSSQDQMIGRHYIPRHSLGAPDEIYSLLTRDFGKETETSSNTKEIHHAESHADEFWDGIKTSASELAGNSKETHPILVAFIDAKDIEKSLAQDMLRLFQEEKYPVLFICERSLLPQSRDALLDLNKYSTAQYADELGIEWAVVDGSDVIAIANASASLIDQIRKGRGVGLLETVSFDHQTGKEFADPILRLKQAMIARGDINQAGFEILQTLEQQMINTIVTETNATLAT